MNRELIRRDYKFELPVIKDDSDDDLANEEIKIGDDELDFEENTQTKQESTDASSKREKVIVRHASVVEGGKVTKTNFFNAESVSVPPPEESATDMSDSMIS